MLAIDLFCGLGGWAEGFLAEGYDVIGFDVERRPYPGQLVLQDVSTLDGAQFREAQCIVASPPCQAYSYRDMPWKRAKALSPPDNALFEACFRIQREACAASGRYIPMVVENVCGAQRWVGRAAWHYGSYYLWGDVPALMPFRYIGLKMPPGNCSGKGNKIWRARPVARLCDSPMSSGVKNGNDWFGSGENCSLQRRFASGSDARKAASAEIAKIPYDLARHVAMVFREEPKREVAA